MERLIKGTLHEKLSEQEVPQERKQFEFVSGELKDSFIIKPTYFRDQRGSYGVRYEREAFEKHGIYFDIHQIAEARSLRGVVRGLHFQKGEFAQAKLVRCIWGTIFDVILDMRPESATYNQWKMYELSEINQNILYVPRGFAHGYVSWTDSIIEYQVDNVYAPNEEGGVNPFDPELSINWLNPDAGMYLSNEEIKINSKDASWPML